MGIVYDRWQTNAKFVRNNLMQTYSCLHAVYRRIRCASLVLLSISLCSCVVGPDYVRPCATVPIKFKEASKNWRVAKPNDNYDRGQWWKIFHDPQLNKLEAQLNCSNQTVATAAANYRQASDLVDEARASYFPTLIASASITRQKSAAIVSSSGTSGGTVTPGSASAGTTGTVGAAGPKPVTNNSFILNASWEPDIWGSVRRTVEASVAGAEASDALLVLTRLMAQASLAQFYFELRTADKDRQLLNDTVANYKEALTLTKNQYASGVAGQADIVQAQTQLETAQAQAINYKINRAVYEHAIAVLIGLPPSLFSIAYNPLSRSAPLIPVEIPTTALERRPDVAQAERLMAQANANIGVAIAAYYPNLTLSASGTAAGKGSIAHWLAAPIYGWAVGPQLAETLFDGGLRNATTAAARAVYDSSVASYRQVVLAAIQDVEDNLATLRILKEETVALDKAAASARLALKLVTNQYKSGTVPYSSVITAQTTAYTAEKNAADTRGLQMTSAVGLIRALGGNWNVRCIFNDA